MKSIDKIDDVENLVFELCDAVETIFSKRYDIDLDHVEIPNDSGFYCLASVDLGELSRAWGLVLKLRRRSN